MSVVFRSRRQFLVGTGGAVLALPILTSLLPKKARAQATQALPRFLAIASSHGAVRESNMYPSDQTLTQTAIAAGAGHEVRCGNLSLSVNGGRASLSPVLTASSSKFTQRLASKMNVLRGFDLSWNIGHHTGGHLGNFSRNDQNKLPNQWRPTIDQVMAYSRSFYTPESLRSNKMRSMHVGEDGNFAISWGYSNNEKKEGQIVPVPTSFSSKGLFDAIFVNQPAAQQSARVAVVDRVYASYKGLSDGAFGDAKRLSKADKDRLNDHMQRIAELQRRVNAVATCGDVMPPAKEVDKVSGGVQGGIVRPDLTREFYETFNDVIVAAFMCGTSRIATVYPQGFTTYAGDWHQEVAHTAQNNDRTQATLSEENRKFFETAFVDLASKLDVDEANGKTLLDNTLMMWTQESGPSTHDPIGLPVVTAGSGAGYFKTGLYADYRRIERDKWTDFYPGLLYNQWLANVLLAMGVPRSEWERGGPGYGYQYTETVYGDPNELWPDRIRRAASEVLAFIKA